MLSGVGIICFAASYAVALALEVSRLAFRSGVRGAVMLGFAGAGLVAHSAFLFYQAADAHGLPLSSEFDWWLIAAWILVVVYLYLAYYHPQTAFGVFLLPLTLGLIGTAAWFADREPFAREPASVVWGIVHGISILLATVSVLVGFSAGLMYLGQVRRLKHKLPPIRGLRLPSLEWLQRANSRAIVISVVMLGIGVLSGMVLSRIRVHTGKLPWYDPVVLSTLLMFTWLLGAAIAGVFYKPARQGSKVAYLTLVSFIFLVIALSVGLFLNTQHGGKDQAPRSPGEPLGALVILAARPHAKDFAGFVGWDEVPPHAATWFLAGLRPTLQSRPALPPYTGCHVACDARACVSMLAIVPPASLPSLLPGGSA